MKVETDFQIVHFMNSETVAGRICRGDLYVGHHFTLILRRVFSGPVEKLICDEEFLMPIDLEITQIEAYGRFHQSLPCGMTAGIRLRGDDISVLQDLVKAADDRTLYSLVSPAT